MRIQAEDTRCNSMALQGWGYLIAPGSCRRYRLILVPAVFDRRSLRIAVSKAAQKYPHPLTLILRLSACQKYPPSRNVILGLGACLERGRGRYSIVRPVAVTGIGKLTLNLVRRFNRTPNA